MKARKHCEIIAHRGACGYVPEHTLAAKAMAFAMGSDYLEQDLVATRDDEVIVSHDIHLDRVTDVASRFPDRARADGRYYARDFDLDEVRALSVTERVDDKGEPVFPERFPAGRTALKIPTLREELQLIQGMNRTAGRNVGIYPEIKAPAWHRAEGADLARMTLEILDEFGYRRRGDRCYVQCFDWTETQRMRDDLGTDLKLVQLIADPSWSEADTDYEALIAPAGLRELAGTVDGIGPWINQLYELEPIDGCPVSTGVVANAQAAGLDVHPYTFRRDALPAGFTGFDELLGFFIDELGVNGLFTDFPDLAVRFVRRT